MVFKLHLIYIENNRHWRRAMMSGGILSAGLADSSTFVMTEVYSRFVSVFIK